MRDDVTTASRPVTATAAAKASTASVAAWVAVAVGRAAVVAVGVRPRALAVPDAAAWSWRSMPGRWRVPVAMWVAQENLVVGRSCRSPPTYRSTLSL
jgi:hypothetical protein